MIAIEPPFTEAKVRALKVGDMVSINGTLYTGRDAFHKYLHDGNPSPVDLRDQIIYHCGPVVVREGERWVVKAAGPTTSIREEPYQGDILRQFGVRGVIGKGGMGKKTLDALGECGAVYMHAVGGAAQVLARCVSRVKDVYLLDELGSPEAVWELEVENFPVVITMDSHGGSLHQEILARSSQALDAIL